MNETQSSSAGFDPARAARLRSQALDKFQAKGRTAARCLYASLLVCLVFAVIEIWLFFRSTDVQSWILFAVLFLVVFETTVLMKLWFWVVNAKLGILREIKLLRMDLAAQKGSMDALEELARSEMPIVRTEDLALWERVVWGTAIILVALLVGGIIVTSRGNSLYFFSARSVTEFRTSITLNADGTGNERLEWKMQNCSLAPLAEFPMSKGGSVNETKAIPAAESPYSDGLGRKLAVRREPAGPNHRDVIRFVEPVQPFGRFTLAWLRPAHATREGDLWTLHQTHGPTSQRTHYSHTIVLPSGAEIVAVDPQTSSQEVRDGNRILHFEANRGSMVQWSYTLKYRLAAP